MQRIISLLLVVMLVVTSASYIAFADTSSEGKDVYTYDGTISDYEYDLVPYSEYIAQYEDVFHAKDSITKEAVDYSVAEDMTVSVLDDYEGEKGKSILTEEQGKITWAINVPNTALFNLNIQYFPIEGKSSDIQRTIMIDGEIPFREARNVNFPRIWADAIENFQSDNKGNELRPSQIEKPEWCTQNAQDARKMYDEDFLFYLEAGEHTITLLSEREPMVIKAISLSAPKELRSYAEVEATYEKNGYIPAVAETIIIEAEKATIKSSPMLYPVTDFSSPAVTPYSPSQIKMNTIGGNNWKEAGNWIEWEFEVEETGLYNISYNAKQNFVRGVPVSRKIYIDGKVPFKEAECVDFVYDSSWVVRSFGEEKPYAIYLEKGKHTIRMEATLDNIAESIRVIEQAVRDFNKIYRDLVMVLGTTPDPYRDYNLEKTVPNISARLEEQMNNISAVQEHLYEISGKYSDREAILGTMVKQLEKFVDDPERLVRRLENFKQNISALGTWLISVMEQPLQLDKIYITPAGSEKPQISDSFWDKLLHEIKILYFSFIIDYNSIGNIAEDSTDTITVWVGTGRDQANIIKALIDETFTKDTGINVNLMLVQMDTLLQATLSGQGPDVAMQVMNNIPMNYGMRDAVADLRQFEDYKEVESRFMESAMVPYKFRDSVFALPETLTFNMMFYRKDILNELGLEVPETWDDVKAMMSTISKNHMEFGMQPTPDTMFGMFLYQMGGEFYTKDGASSALDTELGINAFKEWVRYYTDYTLTREFNFVNRFRTGEVCIGIADYTVYNTLQVSAPEIMGDWGFTAVPGTIRKDNTIDHSVPSTGKAIIMMESTENKDAAWEFMKWWTSAPIQERFGREMEGLLGPAARYPTANIEAISKLPWPIEDYNNFTSQFENTKGLPEVPGGYYTPRCVNNAFYEVVISEEIGAREALMDQTIYINDEIKYKREEFGLETN